MIRTVIRDVFTLTEASALRILAIVAVLSALVYYLVFVASANLIAWYSKPLIDLLKMLPNDPQVQWRMLLGMVILIGLYIAGWRAIQSIQSSEGLRLAWTITIVGSLAAVVVLLYLYPFDAADIFDNIMHARILTIYGENPFHDVAVQFRNDPFEHYVAWRSTPTAYGPLWELLAGLTARLAGNGIVANVMAFKLLPGIFMVATVVVVVLFLRRVALERALAGAWLVAMNPVLLFETIGNGHNDIAMAFWIVAAAALIYQQRYTRAVIALLLGGLVKYIPIMLVPIVLWIALLNLPNLRARIRYLVVTGVVALAITVVMFAPFWDGPAILTISRRTHMFTTSLPSIVYQFLGLRIGVNSAANWVSRIAAGLTVLFALWQAWGAGKERSWLSFTRAALATLIFYLLVTSLWFQQWYVIWLVGLAALLPMGLEQSLALWIVFISMSKPFIFGPVVFLQSPPDPIQWLELRLSTGVMAPSWLAAWWGLWKKRKNVYNRVDESHR